MAIDGPVIARWIAGGVFAPAFPSVVAVFLSREVFLGVRERQQRVLLRHLDALVRLLAPLAQPLVTIAEWCERERERERGRGRV